MKILKNLKNKHIIQFSDAGFRLCVLGHKENGSDRTDFDLPGKIPGPGFTKVKHDPKPNLKKFPHNYGVVLDREHLVIDVDPRNFPEGRNSWKELQTDLCINLEKLCQCVVETGGGGWHLYFKKPSKVLVRNELEAYPGVEFKAHGRQVVGPGSIHPDTQQPYVMVSGSPNALTDAPDELLELIEKSDVKLEQGLAGYDDSANNMQITRQELEGHPPAIEGQGGDQMTYRAACVCRDNGVSPDAALELLEGYNARCEPPWSVDDLALKVKNAYRYGQNAPGAKSVKNDFEHVKVEGDETIVSSFWPLCATDLGDFLSLDIPPRENILAPIIQTQCLVMIFAKRGVGKTYLALSIAYAIASGGTFLKWQAVKPYRVLYIDGEMPAKAMQDRLSMIKKSADKTPLAGYFKVINADLNLHTIMPDLSLPEGRKAIEPFVEETDVIVIDNISTLSRTGKENEGESWLPVQQWALDMRRRGKTVIFVHHAGKTGAQRGTSRREDVLDLVINLIQPDDYKPDDGARFQVHFEKTRNIMGNDTKPFEAMIMHDEWVCREIEDIRLQKVISLKDEGYSFKEIEDETGIKSSTAQRMYSKHKKEKTD